MTVLDPIELEVLRNALTAAAAEMDVTMWRTSRSTIVREMLDYSTAIFDANGNNVAQSARIPQHLNSMGYFLKTILDRFIPVDLRSFLATLSAATVNGFRPLPPAAQRSARLRALPASAPRRPARVPPAVVLGCACDPVHPLRLARDVAHDIGADFREVPPRYDRPREHMDAVSAAITQFVGEV